MHLLKQTFLRLFLLSALLSPLPITANNTTELTWTTAAQDLLALQTFHSLPIIISTPSSSSVSSPNAPQSPLRAHWNIETSQCILTVPKTSTPITYGDQLRGTELLQTFKLLPPPLIPLWQKTLIVHEIAHCHQWTHNPQSLTYSTDNELTQLIQHHEQLADQAALNWVKSAYPKDYPAIHQALYSLRTGLLTQDTLHPPPNPL